MTIVVNEERRTEDRISFELTVGKKTAYVSYFFPMGSINVCVYNSSHLAWKGMGKTLWSFEEAFAAYKSSEVKAMIQFLKDATKPSLSIVG